MFAGQRFLFLLGVAYLGVCRVAMPRGLECVRIAAVAALTRWAVQADRHIPSNQFPNPAVTRAVACP